MTPEQLAAAIEVATQKTLSLNPTNIAYYAWTDHLRHLLAEQLRLVKAIPAPAKSGLHSVAA